MPFEIRRLTQNDADLLDIYLAPHTTEAFYLRANALEAGLCYEGKPLQGTYIAAFQNERMVGAMSFSFLKTILLYADSPKIIRAMTPAMKDVVIERGGRIEAILGIKTLADAFTDCWGFKEEDFRCNIPDWLFDMPMTRFVKKQLPQGFRVRKAEKQDLSIITPWRAHYFVEISNREPSDDLEIEAHDECARKIDRQELFVLENQNKIVAYCGYSGNLTLIPTTIIVGPVWVPQEERGHGYGRYVTSGMIDILSKTSGTLEKVILFASRGDAIRIYESLGFTQTADWRLAFVREDYRLQTP